MKNLLVSQSKHGRVRTWHTVAALTLSLVAASACGGDDDDKTPPRELCLQLAEHTCDRLLDCLTDLTGEAPTKADEDECVNSIFVSADCANAEAVSSGYGECRDGIDNAECEDVFTVTDDGTLEVNDLPPLCEGVIL